MKTSNEVLRYIKALVHADIDMIEKFEGEDAIRMNEPVVNTMIMKINDKESWIITVKKVSGS